MQREAGPVRPGEARGAGTRGARRAHHVRTDERPGRSISDISRVLQELIKPTMHRT